MDINKLDLSKYNIRFNQKKYNHLSVIKHNTIKYILSYHFIGMIDLNKNIFFWANIIPGVNQQFITQNNKIKQLKNNYQDFSKDINNTYYQILNENIIALNKNINTDFIKDFLNKLLNKPIFLLQTDNNKLQVISIQNIIETY